MAGGSQCLHGAVQRLDLHWGRRRRLRIWLVGHGHLHGQRHGIFFGGRPVRTLVPADAGGHHPRGHPGPVQPRHPAVLRLAHGHPGPVVRRGVALGPGHVLPRGLRFRTQPHHHRHRADRPVLLHRRRVVGRHLHRLSANPDLDPHHDLGRLLVPAKTRRRQRPVCPHRRRRTQREVQRDQRTRRVHRQ